MDESTCSDMIRTCEFFMLRGTWSVGLNHSHVDSFAWWMGGPSFALNRYTTIYGVVDR